MKSHFCFPKTFLWGAATSAYQVEGNNHNQWSEWEKQNAAKLVKTINYDIPEARELDNYISGKACDHYDNYKTDFDLLDKMNMNAYRLSIEWSRIEPHEGEWDQKQIQYYKRYINELLNRNIEPVVTLFHFTLPVWLSDKGGFAKRSNLKYFERYVAKILTEIDPRVKYIITINEPEIYATMGYQVKIWPPAKGNLLQYLWVVNNLALAHNRASKIIHELRKDAFVSIAKNSCHIYAGNDSAYSKMNVKVLQYIQDYFVLNKVMGTCDYLGLNFYFSARFFGHKMKNPNKLVNDLGWDMQPANIQYVIERLYKRYNKPILITENGVADSKDQYRKWWIEQTLEGMQKAMKNGVNLIGYLHWSLIDNFEWVYGKWPCLGLAKVDYKSGRRSLRKSAIWFGQQIKRIRRYN